MECKEDAAAALQERYVRKYMLLNLPNNRCLRVLLTRTHFTCAVEDDAADDYVRTCMSAESERD